MAKSLGWSFLAELFSRILQPAIFLLLAVFLKPEDFGVMTSALMVLAFVQIFWDAGMSKAIIQRQTEFEEAMNFAFLVNTGSGLFFAGLLFCSADLIAREVFHDNRVADVLEVMTILVIFASLSATQQAYLRKIMKFDKIFWVRLTAIGAPALASLPLAFYGYGYWSLVIGAVLGQISQFIIFWLLSDWRPSVVFDIEVSRGLARFGSWVWITGLLVWAFAWLDMFFVGRYFGLEDLGSYRFGYQLISLAFVLLFSFINPVLYSHLSRQRGDREIMAEFCNLAIRTISMVAVPISFFVLKFQSDLVEIFLDEKWQALGSIIGPLAILHGYSWIVGMNGEFYRAMGKPNAETMTLLGLILIYVGGYIYSINYDLITFVYVRVALAIFALFVHLFIVSFFLKLGILKFVIQLLLYSAISFWGLEAMFSFWGLGEEVTVIDIFLVGFAYVPLVLAAVVFCFGMQHFMDLRSIVFRG